MMLNFILSTILSTLYVCADSPQGGVDCISEAEFVNRILISDENLSAQREEEIGNILSDVAETAAITDDNEAIYAYGGNFYAINIDNTDQKSTSKHAIIIDGPNPIVHAEGSTMQSREMQSITNEAGVLEEGYVSIKYGPPGESGSFFCDSYDTSSSCRNCCANIYAAKLAGITGIATTCHVQSSVIVWGHVGCAVAEAALLAEASWHKRKCQKNCTVPFHSEDENLYYNLDVNPLSKKTGFFGKVSREPIDIYSTKTKKIYHTSKVVLTSPQNKRMRVAGPLLRKVSKLEGDMVFVTGYGVREDMIHIDYYVHTQSCRRPNGMTTIEGVLHYNSGSGLYEIIEPAGCIVMSAPITKCQFSMTNFDRTNKKMYHAKLYQKVSAKGVMTNNCLEIQSLLEIVE